MSESSSLFLKAKIRVVDSIDQCAEHGESSHAIKGGVISSDGLTEMGEPLQRKAAIRKSDFNISIADLTGLALQDMQRSKAVWDAYNKKNKSRCIRKKTSITIWALFFSLFVPLLQACSPAPTIMSPENETGDYVVLLHGIAKSNRHMKTLGKNLRTHGYDVINIDYPSTDKTIEEIAHEVQQTIGNSCTRTKPLHFVGYSLGAIVTRALIHKSRPKNLGRVVFLGPPNHGSEVADFWKNFFLYRWIFGPAGQQLDTNLKDVAHLFGKVDYELGIIAGNRSVDPSGSLLIPGKDDGKVSIESTKLKGMKDHIVVTANHMLMPSHRSVIEQTLYFLEFGEFQRSASLP